MSGHILCALSLPVRTIAAQTDRERRHSPKSLRAQRNCALASPRPNGNPRRAPPSILIPHSLLSRRAILALIKVDEVLLNTFCLYLETLSNREYVK